MVRQVRLLCRGDGDLAGRQDEWIARALVYLKANNPIEDNGSWETVYQGVLAAGNEVALAMRKTAKLPDGDSSEVTQDTVPAGPRELEEIALQYHDDLEVLLHQAVSCQANRLTKKILA